MAKSNIYGNNGRHVPDTISENVIKPVASVVNQQIQYRDRTDEIALKQANLARGLAQLADGINDFDEALEKRAKFDVAKAASELAENQKQWADISNKVTGLAHFNPYLRDAYNKYTSKEIVRQAVLELNSMQDVEKLDGEKYLKRTNEIRNKALSALKENGIPPNAYGKAIIDFDDSLKQHSQIYNVSHAKYMYDKTCRVASTDIANTIAAHCQTDRSFTSVEKGIANFVETAEANGIVVPDKQAEVIINGVVQYCTKHPSDLNTNEVILGLKNVKLSNGQTISDIIPDYEISLADTIRKVKRINFEDTKFNYEVQKFNLNQSKENATKEFFTWFKDNQNASDEERMQKAKTLINQYGIDGEEGISFLQNIATTRNYFSSLQTTITNEATLASLTIKGHMGDLTATDISKAVAEHQISPKDSITLTQLMVTQEQKQVNETSKEIQSMYKQYIKDPKSIQYKSISNKTRDEMGNTLVQIENAVRNGTITPQQGRLEVEKLRKAIPKLEVSHQVQNKNYNCLVNLDYRRNINVPSEDRMIAIDAFRNSGILRNKYGTPDKTSTISPTQMAGNNVTGHTGAKHLGYDLNGVYVGRDIYPPSQGTIVASGDGGSMGYYAIFRDDRTGNYMLFQHLQSIPKTGQVTRQQAFAKVGNTGVCAKGGCLHIECWNSNLESIKPSIWFKR